MGLKHQKLQHNNSEWKILIFDMQNRAESSDYNKRKASNTQKLSKYKVWYLITEKHSYTWNILYIRKYECYLPFCMSLRKIRTVGDLKGNEILFLKKDNYLC